MCIRASYPDKAGKVGSAAWGGVKYDHYPDIHQDDKGGAEHNDRLIRRILAEGHQITNHGYRHIIFGRKPFVYGARGYLGSLDVYKRQGQGGCRHRAHQEGRDRDLHVRR